MRDIKGKYPRKDQPPGCSKDRARQLAAQRAPPARHIGVDQQQQHKKQRDRHESADVGHPLQMMHHRCIMPEKRQRIGKMRKQRPHTLQGQHDEQQKLKYKGVPDGEQPVQKGAAGAGRQPLQPHLQRAHTAGRRDDGGQHGQRGHKLGRLAAQALQKLHGGGLDLGDRGQKIRQQLGHTLHREGGNQIDKQQHPH